MKFLARTLIVLALVSVVFFLYLNGVAGEFRDIEPVEQGECVEIGGVPGAEDIDLNRGGGIAFISSADRAAMAKGGPGRGGIYAWDIAGGSEPTLLTGDDPDLRPHGISFVETGSDQGLLFVVDHRETGDGTEHSVRIYDWQAGALTERRVVRGEELISPNDVAGLADGTFYATNDHRATGSLGRTVEDFLRLGGGSVVHFDGEGLELVAEGIGYANGIAVDADGGPVYVASTTRGTIHVYDRGEDGELTLDELIETGTGVDNIELDRFGNLWVASHPKLLTFSRHAADPQKRSPSEALWIAKEPTTEPRVRTVWRNEGERLSGASVAVPVGGRLLFGSVFEPHALVCDRTF